MRWREVRMLLGRRGRIWFVALLAGVLVIMVDIVVGGPLTALDKELQKWDGEEEWPWLSSYAWPYDKVGQRSVLIPVLLLVAGVLGRRHRTWRPVVLALLSFLMLNVVVGAMKILTGRAETDTGSPDMFAGGMIFPSGHSSNIILTGGLIIYLLIRYTRNPPVRVLGIAVAVTTIITIATSMYIGSHWLTDLVAGALVGGMLLLGVIAIDRATADIALRPPAVVAGAARRLGLLERDGDAVDAASQDVDLAAPLPSAGLRVGPETEIELPRERLHDRL